MEEHVAWQDMELLKANYIFIKQVRTTTIKANHVWFISAVLFCNIRPLLQRELRSTIEYVTIGEISTNKRTNQQNDDILMYQ